MECFDGSMYSWIRKHMYRIINTIFVQLYPKWYNRPVPMVMSINCLYINLVGEYVIMSVDSIRDEPDIP